MYSHSLTFPIKNSRKLFQSKKYFLSCYFYESNFPVLCRSQILIILQITHSHIFKKAKFQSISIHKMRRSKFKSNHSGFSFFTAFKTTALLFATVRFTGRVPRQDINALSAHLFAHVMRLSTLLLAFPQHLRLGRRFRTTLCISRTFGPELRSKTRETFLRLVLRGTQASCGFAQRLTRVSGLCRLRANVDKAHGYAQQYRYPKGSATALQERSCRLWAQLRMHVNRINMMKITTTQVLLYQNKRSSSVQEVSC